MKISHIDVILMDMHPVDNPGWAPILCRMYTDTGLYGDGEAALAYGNAHRAAFGMVQDFAKSIIGMDPLDNEVIWEKLYKSSFWGQNGGPVVFSGISALDIALWDIRGKYFKAPVYKLLGGKMRSTLRCYASQLQFGWDDRKIPAITVEDYAANALKAVNEGYDAIKIDFFTFAEDGHRFSAEETTRVLTPKNRDMIKRRLSAVREAVGEGVDIIMENHSYIDAQGAVQLGRLAEEYCVLYFEEPCTPTPGMNKFVADRISVPISQGERIYTRWGYAPYFADGSIQLIQPDIGNCGGITETKKICDLAHIYDVGVQAHVCASPLSTAAALQLEAAIPNFTIHEQHVYCRYDYNRRLCVHDYQPTNGRFTVPDLPGLGNELSPYCFEKGEVITVK